MIAATAMCAAAATEAAAQDGSIVLNNQLQLGDVISGQTLNVEGASDQVTVSNSAQGNSLSGSVENGSLTVRSTQTMRGDARATTELTLGGDTEGRVSAVTQAGGNYLAAGAYGADLEIDATQTVDSGEIVANSTIRGGTARLLGGGSVAVSAIANITALGGTGASLTGSINQSSDASVRAGNLAETQYIPATSEFTGQAFGNAVSATSGEASNQNLAVRQRSTGGIIEADVSANAGNAWDLAGRANAAANQAAFLNQGGSIVIVTDQGNTSAVRSNAIVTAYDFGAATAYAQGAGNAVSAGNNDVYVEIDNTQVNSGGVDVSASFSGGYGYDAYVGADAVGNTVTGYACSDCEGVLIATNAQTNDGAVSAAARTTIQGSGRAVITGTNAVGNAASFYVARPGSGD